ncbi:TonB-dependent receptor plug domain-containing protein [Chitinophaga sedimenti]|uniref:TonB-dependent receptor plug domain-containing protein n=1 Tax=Chitinophaga sedimenti TaxID=2033606 RepID=UPI00249E51F8|nr:TonB-dependent receptor plug domain-containing protein [Chitinophaga sedimenti]
MAPNPLRFPSLVTNNKSLPWCGRPLQSIASGRRPFAGPGGCSRLWYAKRANLTGAVTTVDVAKTMQARTITDAGRALQGTVPGLTITTTSGDIGTNPTIRLRGLTGSTNAVNGAQPLILLDNVEIQSLLMVNPDDIESISVLKDAASTSIYGSRAAFGVVLITSKSGKKNTQNKITYSNNFSRSKPTTLPTPADDDGLEYSLAATIRTNPAAKFSSAIGMRFDSASIEKIRQWKRDWGGKNLGPEMVMGRDFEVKDGAVYYYRPWDVNELFIRDWTPQQNHNLNFAGGNDKTAYSLSLGYLGQEGLMKVQTDKFQRTNVNLNVTSSVQPWLDLRSRVMLTRTNQETPFSFASVQYDPLYYLYRWNALYPYGTYEGKPFRNVVSEMQAAQMSTVKANYGRFALGGTIKIAPGLTVDADYTYTNNQAHVREVGGPLTAWNNWGGAPLKYETYTPPTITPSILRGGTKTIPSKPLLPTRKSWATTPSRSWAVWTRKHRRTLLIIPKEIT